MRSLRLRSGTQLHFHYISIHFLQVSKKDSFSLGHNFLKKESDVGETSYRLRQREPKVAVAATHTVIPSICSMDLESRMWGHPLKEDLGPL